MKVISTKTHGILDYVVGGLLVLAPWILGFYQGGVESYLPIILGFTTLLYSMMTDYELGAIKVISMRLHLTIDALSGLFLAASPWLFRFSDTVYLPHLLVGLMELVVVALSTSIPYTKEKKVAGI